MNWFLKVLKQYADFSGRARRKEYWMFALFNMIFIIIALVLDNVLGLTLGELPYGVFYFLYAIAVLIPGLAVSVRRLHDIGKNGWMILIVLIPIIGAIWLFALTLSDSNPGKNQYGPNPKTGSDEEIVQLESSGDTVIFLVVIWMFFSRLFWTLLPKIIDSYYSEEWFNLVHGLTTLIWGIVPIALAFVVKDKSKRIVLFILSGIYLAYELYEVVMIFIR